MVQPSRSMAWAWLHINGWGDPIGFDPRTGKTTTLAAGLHVANGVTLGPDEAYVLVSETLQYRVMRYWLKGPKAG